MHIDRIIRILTFPLAILGAGFSDSDSDSELSSELSGSGFFTGLAGALVSTFFCNLVSENAKFRLDYSKRTASFFFASFTGFAGGFEATGAFSALAVVAFDFLSDFLSTLAIMR